MILISTKKSATEAQRVATFIQQGQRLPKYKTRQGSRFEARKEVSIDSSSGGWVEQDVNMLFKTGNYLFTVPVHGKTDDYNVTIKIIDFLEKLNKALETQQFAVPTFQRVLMDAVNTKDAQVACTCKDFAMRWAYSSTLSDDNAGRPESRPSPVTNPTNQKGCCKHILQVLSRKTWATKVARTLFNYIVDIWKNKKALFDRIIRPALNDITDEKILSKPEKKPEQPTQQVLEPDQPEQSTDTQKDNQNGTAKESLEGNASANQQIEEAVKQFGVTTRLSLAGFILPDGRLLDFSYGQGRRFLDHRDIAQIYGDTVDFDTNSEYMAKFMRDTGAIRIDYKVGSINIDIANEPTDLQYDWLESFITPYDRCYLEFSDYLDTKQNYTFVGQRCNFRHIAHIIRHYFQTGEFLQFKAGNEAVNSYYDGKQQFDDDQEFALQLCHDLGADVRPFVTPENTPEQIEELGSIYKQGAPVELIKTLSDPALSYRTIQIIAKAHWMGIDLRTYKHFAPDALEEIVREVRLGVPLDKVGLRGFNARQIEQLGRAYRISPELYYKICDPKINYNKMRDIIAGRNV